MYKELFYKGVRILENGLEGLYLAAGAVMFAVGAALLGVFYINISDLISMCYKANVFNLQI